MQRAQLFFSDAHMQRSIHGASEGYTTPLAFVVEAPGNALKMIHTRTVHSLARKSFG